MTRPASTAFEITHDAPLTCPSCGREVAGYWPPGRKTADQRCRSCGCVFEATWPGFRFEPETVVIRRAAEAGP